MISHRLSNMSANVLKLVLDTNTIISGLLWKGNECNLLEEIEKGKAQLYLTLEIIEEIDRVLHYPRLSGYIAEAGIQREELLEKILSLAHVVVSQSSPLTLCRDPQDNKFLECAIHVNADFVVSGDRDLLVLKEYEAVKIITTKEALEKISKS